MRTLFIVSLALLSCRREVPPSPPPDAPPPAAETAQPGTPATPTTTTRAASPRAPVEGNIVIDSVLVANPIVVTGRARTFENNVVLRLRDARGSVLTESYTTATGEMGRHSPFRGTLWVTRDPGGRVTVEALEHSAKDGSELSLVSAVHPFTVEMREVRLFFPDPECTAVRAHLRRIPKSVSHARLLVEALIAGPASTEPGAVNPFPAGSRVESVNLRDGVLTVDFNERLRNVGGSCRARMIRLAVSSTLEAVPGVRKVVMTAAGSEELALQP